jgi:hypothetical protein
MVASPVKRDRCGKRKGSPGEFYEKMGYKSEKEGKYFIKLF